MPQPVTETIDRRIPRWEVAFLLGVLVVAASFRLYRFEANLHWLSDEGRDAAVIQRALENHEPLLLGPPTSVTTDRGPLYLGPATYYLMAIGLALTRGSPIGPALAVVATSLATVVGLWFVGRSWFHPIAGVAAAAAYALSSDGILLGRHAWNANFLPAFVLLTLGTLGAVRANRPRWWIGVGVGFGLAVQAHAFGWSLAVPTLVVAGLEIRRSGFARTLRWVMVGALAMVVTLAPLIAYDTTHGGANLRVVMEYLREHRSLAAGIGSGILDRLGEPGRAIADALLGGPSAVGWGTVALATAVALATHRRWGTNERSGLALVASAALAGVLALVLYPEPIFIQYGEVLWIPTYLAVGWIVWRTGQSVASDRLRWIGIAAAVVTVTATRLAVNPSIVPPPYDLAATRMAAAYVAESGAGSPFAFTLVSSLGHHDDAYRYVLARTGLVPVDPAEAQQAFVVCEPSACNDPIPAFARVMPEPRIVHTWRLPNGSDLFRIVRDPAGR